MRTDNEGKRRLEPADGRRIDAAAKKRGMNKSEFARKVSPETMVDPRHHLREVLMGREPLGDEYAHHIADALGCGLDRLWRIIGGFDDFAVSQFPSFTVVGQSELSPIWKADGFYNGSRPTWEDLEAGFDIPRIAYTKKDGIRSRLKGLLTQPGGLQALAIIGAGGVGKSTLLRRAAYDAAKSGNLVLVLNSEWANKTEGVIQQLHRACDSSALPVVVVIDDISNDMFDGSVLQRILNELEHLRVILLIAEHPDRCHGVLKRLPVLVHGINCWVHPVHQLSDDECEVLVDRILAFEGNGTLSQVFCNLPREGRLALCQEIAARHLVVAMLQMRYGLKFEKIIENEYERIPIAAGKEAYALVCYFETLRLYLPPNLLLRVLGVTTPVAMEEFFECTEGLFEDEIAGMTSRNRLIARTVAKRAFARPEAKKAALVNIFTELNTGDEGEMALFLRAFTGEGVHRRFVVDLARNEKLIGEFYQDLLVKLQDKPADIKKFIHSSHGLANRVLQNPDAARSNFQQALDLDSHYGFAYRQLAWLELSQGNWDVAAKSVQKAAQQEPNNFRAVYDTARILTLNTVRWFPQARQYWLRAIELDPVSEDLKKEWEIYQDFAKQLEYISGLKEDDLIPEFIWKHLRPGLLFDKMRFGPKDRRVLKTVKKNLKLMQQDTKGSVLELNEKLAGMDIDADKALRALHLANIARLEFVSWRQQDSALSVEELETLFEDGIHLNPEDPFVHCWFGTFLKEVKEDFENAEKEYRRAIELSNDSSDRLLREHPLFLNNLALLIIDEVELKRRKPDELKQAKLLLEKAAARVPETKPDFFWPDHNLDWCKTLMEQFGVK
jgi:tetratricopeptide (TPR) repeat protein